MQRFNGSRSGACLILALLLVVSRAPAQEKARDKPASSTEKTNTSRITYFVHRGKASDLASALAAHFKNAAEVQALPDTFGNCLLISGPAAVTDEVMQLLSRIDRRPQTFSVEILVAEIPAKKADAANPDRPAKELDPKQFTGPAADVVAKLQSLCQEGRISTLRRARLSVVESLPSSVMLTENKPMVTGGTITATGHTTRNIAYRMVGIQASLTARVDADQKIEIDLTASNSRLEPDDTVVLTKDDNGTPIMASDIVNARFSGKLTLSSGSAAATDGVITKSKTGGERTLIVVTAKVIDPDAKPEKEETPLETPPMRPRRPRRDNPPPPPPVRSIERTNPM
jgi:hypothetical protein